jgi:2-(1,2-epoxy-1,2-dihydrophenyl)acetyl-CoA isomerase
MQPISGAVSAARFGDVTAETGSDYVATVEMHRPPANYFDTPLLEGLAAAVEWADEQGCRAVLLCSQGKHFCAGAQIGGGRRALDADLYTAGLRLFAQQLPVVAAVVGGAIGGGLGLALAADFRVAAPESRFSANFATLGFHHGFGLTVTLPEVVGAQRARELLYTGRRIDGAEAFRIGLCDRLAEAGAVREEARRLAAEIAAAAPLAVRAIRATMRDGLEARVHAALGHELDEQRRLAATEDFKEGVRASRERARPHFTGR